MRTKFIVGALLAGAIGAHAQIVPERGQGQHEAAPAGNYFDQFKPENRERAAYLSEYDAIMSPEAARSFIQKYADHDPDGLTRTAMQRGYERGIEEARKCIAFSERTIADEREIGRTVGYENKAAIYQAGRNLLICKRTLAHYQAEAKTAH